MNALTKKLMELDEEQLARLYMRVFNNDDGQLVLQDLKNRSFIETPTGPDVAPVDAWLMAVNEGKRRVVLTIQTLLEPIEPQTEMKPTGDNTDAS